LSDFKKFKNKKLLKKLKTIKMRKNHQKNILKKCHKIIEQTPTLQYSSKID
jgi:hypothetical protein